MLSDGETGPGVIRDQTLFGVHLPTGNASTTTPRVLQHLRRRAGTTMRKMHARDVPPRDNSKRPPLRLRADVTDVNTFGWIEFVKLC
jgi:hypothetical protein